MKVSAAEIVDSIGRMSVLEVVALVQDLREQFGVELLAAAPKPMDETKWVDLIDTPATSFNVVLVNTGDQKIQVIKAVREVTTLGLKEAKDLVDSIPRAVKEGVNRDEADALKRKLEEAGASVEVKPA